MSDMLTIEQFTKVLPKKMKTTVSPALIDKINNTISDSIFMETYRDNLLSFTSVMTDGRFKIQQYLDAVRYVSFKLYGSSNIDAYIKTFPDRYQHFITIAISEKDISSYVCAYNKTKLVNLILEQTLIPVHILNADIYQKAINVQAELMLTSNSDKVRTTAADSLLNHLKKPEAAKVELDITVKHDSAIDDLRASTLELVKAQKALIASGGSTAQQIAHSKLTVAEEKDEGTIVEADFTEIPTKVLPNTPPLTAPVPEVFPKPVNTPDPVQPPAGLGMFSQA
jgi:hypothetical protein